MPRAFDSRSSISAREDGAAPPRSGRVGAPQDGGLRRQDLRRVLQRSRLPPPRHLTEHDHSGRNRIFIVGAGGRRWIAKASRSDTESWFYGDVGHGLAWVPAHVQVGEPTVTVTEYLADVRTVFEIAEDDPESAIGDLVAVAPLLAELHRWSPVPAARIAAPPLPELAPAHVSLWVDSPPSSQQILRRIQARPCLRQALHATHRGHGPKGLIHGDIKPDNVLATSRGPVVIDWELCGRGPLAWDLGSLVGSILAIWLDGVDLRAAAPDAWLEGSRVPYHQVRDAVGQVLADYRRHAGPAVPASALVACTASWLITRTWAASLFHHKVNPRHLLRLVVSEGLLRNPTALFSGVSP